MLNEFHVGRTVKVLLGKVIKQRLLKVAYLTPCDQILVGYAVAVDLCDLDEDVPGGNDLSPRPHQVCGDHASQVSPDNVGGVIEHLADRRHLRAGQKRLKLPFDQSADVDTVVRRDVDVTPSDLVVVIKDEQLAGTPETTSRVDVHRKRALEGIVTVELGSDGHLESPRQKPCVIIDLADAESPRRRAGGQGIEFPVEALEKEDGGLGYRNAETWIIPVNASTDLIQLPIPPGHTGNDIEPGRRA